MHRRSALIISISSDIGYALALDLAQKGWDVGGTYRTPSRDTADLEGRGMFLVRCDLAKAGEAKRAAKALADHFATWDLLVLAPGAQDPIGLFADTEFDEWAASLQVNFIEQLHITRTLLPTRNMQAEHGPCVLFFAGGGSNSATVRYSAYTISKVALIKMCELLHAEVADTRFTILGPGWVKTKIHLATLNSGQKAGANLGQTQDRFAKGNFVPMERVIECCSWIIAAPRDVVGGRNFSAANDACGNERLTTQLLKDPNMYKLRRAGNDWKP